jgi:hypothetical protein
MDIVNRAKNMLMSPATEWQVIAGETTDIQTLYTSYIMPLAAIPPLAGLIGRAILFPRMSFGTALIGAIVFYVLSLIAVYVVAWIAAKLAPMFGGTDNVDSGLKLVAYSSTARWVGGIFRIIPPLGILSLLASLYGIYLFYTGITPIMNVPAGRAVPYLLALIVATILVFIVIGVLVAGVMGAGMGMMM